MLLVNQLHTGGAQKVIANLSYYLADNYNIFLAIYNDLENIAFDYRGNLIKIKLPHDADTHHNGFYKRASRFFSLIRKVKRIKKENKIDVTISFMEASNIINLLAKSGDKRIISVRSYLSHEFNDHPRLRIFKPVIKLLYKKADTIVAPAELLKKDLVDNFSIPKEKIVLLYNFIDSKAVQELKAAPIPIHHEELFQKFPVLINVGRINTPKAQWLLIPLIKEVKKQYPEVKLVILGEGRLKEKVINTANSAGLKVYIEGEKNKEHIFNYDIYFFGFTKNPYPYLIRSRLFIKSSVYEGFPNVIIEAMSCGIPIISSDCQSGPREIINPSTGFEYKTAVTEFGEYGVLVPTGDSYPMFATEAVELLIADKEKHNYYSEQSVKRAADFEREIIIEQWKQLIEN